MVPSMSGLRHVLRTLTLSTLFGAAAFAASERTQLVQNEAEPFGFEELTAWNLDHFNNAYARQQKFMADPLTTAAFNAWLNTLEPARALPLIDQIQFVTEAINNRIQYTRDSVNHGAAEYYDAPIETILSRKGDCEDYAIAKYYALRWLGVPANRLYIAAVTREGAGHCVLLVDTSADFSRTDVIVMDNGPQNSRHILGATEYVPKALFNEHGVYNVRRVRAVSPG